MAATARGIQEVITALVQGCVPLTEIQELLHHPAAVVRVNALNALVPQARSDDRLVENMVAAAEDPLNDIRLMGTISVRHHAVACLYRVGNLTASRWAANLLATWPEPDRSDLVWYLRSEGYIH